MTRRDRRAHGAEHDERQSDGGERRIPLGELQRVAFPGVTGTSLRCRAGYARAQRFHRLPTIRTLGAAVLPSPRRALPLLAVVLLLAPLAACASGGPEIDVGNARAAVPAGGATQVVVEVTNTGDGDDELVGASTPAAAAAELHLTEIEDGQATMSELDAVTIPAGETVAFRPGGLHLMLVLPDESVAEGGTFPITLQFDRSGEIAVDVQVVPMADLADDAVTE